MKHIGNLIITAENQSEFQHITEVSGHVDVYPGVTFTAPALNEVSGSVDVREGATFAAPALTSINEETIEAGNFHCQMIGQWESLATPKYLQIGCQRHTWKQWKKLTDSDIAKMDSSALETAHQFRITLEEIEAKLTGEKA